jgi:hypothetical protein
VVVSKPFQCYYKRAKVLREGQSVKWNEELFFYSLEAAKMTIGCFVKKVTATEPPVKKAAEPLVKQGLRRGFLNSRPKVPINPTSPQKVTGVGMVGPSSPTRGCLTLYSSKGNGFSLSHNWALDGAFEEEALAIRRHGGRVTKRENVSTPKVRRQKEASKSAKFH